MIDEHELAEMSPDERRARSRMMLAERLETAVDSIGLPAVLDMLAQVARDKAEHVLETWQDAPLARRWRSAAGLLERVSRQSALNPDGTR